MIKIILTRLYPARVILVTTLIVLSALAASRPALLPHCAFGYFVILLVSVLVPRSDKVQNLRQIAERRRQRTWPRNAMKSVTEALDDPCFILDRNSVVRYANSASEEVFGATSLGMPLSFKFRVPELTNIVDETTKTGERHSIVYEERAARKRWFSVDCIPIPRFANRKTSKRPAKFILLLFTDLAGIRQTEQMRSDFVANASHELRTPLASLRGYIETLQGPAKDDKNAREEFLNIMLEQAERMSRLINDLLSLSQIEMKANQPPDETVELCEILAHVKDVLEPAAKQRNITLKISGSPGPVELIGDRDELIQVFHNLMENACKYGREDGVVEARLDVFAPTPGEPREIRVAISDDGPGIASTDIPRLTERFYRAQNNNPEIAKGTGLGLAIVKHIVNRHRASLEITSELGKGTTVAVTFHG